MSGSNLARAVCRPALAPWPPSVLNLIVPPSLPPVFVCLHQVPHECQASRTKIGPKEPSSWLSSSSSPTMSSFSFFQSTFKVSATTFELSRHSQSPPPMNAAPPIIKCRFLRASRCTLAAIPRRSPFLSWGATERANRVRLVEANISILNSTIWSKLTIWQVMHVPMGLTQYLRTAIHFSKFEPKSLQAKVGTRSYHAVRLNHMVLIKIWFTQLLHRNTKRITLNSKHRYQK